MAGPCEVWFYHLERTSLDQALPEGALLAPAAEPVGPMQSPRAERGHLLDVVAWVAAGRLHVEWQYAGELHEAAAVEGWAAAHLAWLRRLLARCTELRASGACILPGFLNATALARMADEARMVAPCAHWGARGPGGTVYLEPPDPGFPEGHPRRRLRLCRCW